MKKGGSSGFDRSFCGLALSYMLSNSITIRLHKPTDGTEVPAVECTSIEMTCSWTSVEDTMLTSTTELMQA